MQTTAHARRAPLGVIRPISAWDGFELQQFVRDLSPASRYSRFMMAMRELPEEMLDRFLFPAPGREAVLVATSAHDDIVGMAQFAADHDGDGCEVALVVSDAWQRQGLGTRLLTSLATVAVENSLRHLHADVLADNYAMRALARKIGCQVKVNPQAHFLVQISRTLEPSFPGTGPVNRH